MEDKVPRQYSLVRLTEETKQWLIENGHDDSPLVQHDVFVYLGEIPNMPGHCVLASHKDGVILSGYHIEDFEEIPEEET